MPTVVTRPAFGLPGFNYWGGQTMPFIDILKSSRNGNFFDSIYAGAGQWLYGLPNGVATQTEIVWTPSVEYGTHLSTLKTGTYIIEWPGGATVTVDPNASGVVNISAVTQIGNVKRRTFDVTLDPPGQITLWVTNTSGATADLAPQLGVAYGCRVYHSDYESLINAGEIFDPNFLDSLDPTACIRGMDWLGANILGAQASLEFTDFVTEDSRVWSGGRMPPSVLGKLAKKLNCDLWITLPVKCTEACMLAISQAIFDTGFSGKLYAEFSNETWNTAAPFFESGNWLRDTKAAGLDADGSGSPLIIYNSSGGVVAWASATDNQKKAAGMAHGALQLWKAAETVFGRSRVARVLAGQAASFGNISAEAYEYIDPGILSLDSRMKDLTDEHAIAPYLEMAATAAMPTITLKALCEQRADLLADSDWEASWKTHVDNTLVGYSSSNANALAAKNPNIKLTSYESGMHFFATTLRFENDAQGYSFTIEAGVLRSASDISAAFTTGEQIRGHFNGGAEYASAIAGPEAVVYCRRLNTTDLKVYPTEADANADTNAFTLDGPAQTYKFDNFTRVVALDTKARGIMNGTLGRTVDEYYYAQVFEGKLTFRNQFVSTAGHGYGSMWGMKRADRDADNPRYTWFRSLAAGQAITARSSGRRSSRGRRR